MFDPVGDGSYLYHYDVTSETAQPRFEDSTAKTIYNYNELRVWAPLSANAVTAAYIAERWPSDYEQKLINEYNTAQMGLLDDVSSSNCIDAYRSFLAERVAVKKKIDADFALWSADNKVLAALKATDAPLHENTNDINA